jgi:Flp pilus assembly pilin Flp
MTELEMAVLWVMARHQSATKKLLAGKERDERGVSAVEWLLIIIAAVGICGAVALAVKTFVDGKTADLNG